MTNNKSAESKRLIIYLVLAFGIAWVPWIILNDLYGFEEWFSGEMAFPLMWVLLISGGAPAIANVLTRLITKEGFDDDLLRLKLRGNIKYYMIAAIVPAVTGLLRGLVFTLMIGDIRGEAAYPGLKGASLIAQAVPMSLVMAFNTFGEEYGWRGYMNGKLETLTNKPVTVVLGGIIWGLWHAPLTVKGHNFGTDYPGFPWLGVVLMCIFCVLTGIFLMWLTDKSGAIYPAAVAHSANNNGSTFTMSAVLRGIKDIKPTMLTNAVNILLTALVYGAFAIFMIKDGKKREAADIAK